MERAVYHVVHETHYEYAAPVALSQQLLHLTPRSLPYQQVLAHDIDVEPVPSEVSEREDYFGNRVVRLALQTPHQELRVRAESTVAVRERDASALLEESPPWEAVCETLHRVGPAPLLEPSQFLFESPHVPLARQLAEYAAPSFPPGRAMLAAARDLASRIHEDFEFRPRATTVSTPLIEVLAKRRGVCQDFAHFMVGCLRAIGLAARYVSGYLLTTPPPGRPRLVGADASHAWVSAYCPNAGWVDFDPTNRLMPSTEHITLAFGRDFSDVSPLRGVILGSGEHELTVRVTVAPADAGSASAGLP